MNAATIKQTIPAPSQFDKCYACDCLAVGVAERWSNGKKSHEFACKRHMDATIKVTLVCRYCAAPVRKGSLSVGDGMYAHHACHAEAEREGRV